MDLFHFLESSNVNKTIVLPFAIGYLSNQVFERLRGVFPLTNFHLYLISTLGIFLFFDFRFNFQTTYFYLDVLFWFIFFIIGIHTYKLVLNGK